MSRISRIRFRAVVYRKLTGDETNYQPADQIYSSAPTGLADSIKWAQKKMESGDFSHGIVNEITETAVWDSRHLAESGPEPHDSTIHELHDVGKDSK